METTNEQSAKIFKALCDANRLSILQQLRTGEKCACRLQDALQIGQSTLSHHMRILCESGLVDARKDGKWTYYSIDRTGCDVAASLLQTYTQVESDTHDDCCIS